MRNIGIKELIDYIIKNRSKCAFKDYSHNRIVNEIKMSIKCNCFCFSLNEKEEINGVVCGERFDKDHYIFVYDILTTEKGVIAKFMKQYMIAYKDWPLIGHIRDRFRTFYNPSKLERRLQ